MSGSGFDEINSTQNQSNSTDPNLKKLALTFAEAGAFVQTFVQLLLCTIAFVAIVRVRALRVGRNVYMVNMVLSDIARVIIGLLVFIYGMTTQKFGSLAQKNFCVYFLFLAHWHFFWSMWATILIVRSRYLTICNPLAPGVSTRRAAIASIVTCAMGIVIAMPPLFTWAKYTNIYSIENGEQCVIDFSNHVNHLSHFLFYYGLSYVLPVVVITYYLAATLKRVLQSAIERRRLTALSSNSTETEQQSTTPIYKSKAFWYVIALVASTAICPAVYVIVHSRLFQVSSKVFAAADMIFTTNFLVNSVLYCFWVRTLTRSLWNVLRCRKLRTISVRN